MPWATDPGPFGAGQNWGVTVEKIGDRLLFPQLTVLWAGGYQPSNWGKSSLSPIFSEDPLAVAIRL